MTKITFMDLAGAASGLCFAIIAEWAIHAFHPIPLQSEAAWMLFALGGSAFLAGNYAARGVIDLSRARVPHGRSRIGDGDSES